MITLLVLFGLLALVGWGTFRKVAHGLLWDSSEGTAVVLGGVVLGIVLMLLGFVRAVNTVGNAELELAYSTTIQNYETTANNVQALLSTNSSTAKFIDGSIEKMQVASAVSERIVELRDQVNRLNEIVITKNAWAHEYILGGFLWTPPAPEYLKLYILQ